MSIAPRKKRSWLFWWMSGTNKSSRVAPNETIRSLLETNTVRRNLLVNERINSSLNHKEIESNNNYSISNNHNSVSKNKTLVLDLDETCAHSSFIYFKEWTYK